MEAACLKSDAEASVSELSTGCFSGQSLQSHGPALLAQADCVQAMRSSCLGWRNHPALVLALGPSMPAHK